MSSADWYYCNLYAERLYRQFAFLPVQDYLWRYAQGDSPLTPQAVALALEEPSETSSTLRLLADQLFYLISDYEIGRLNRKQFTSQLKETTKEIRKLASKIRKDRFLDYLDQREDHDVPSYRKPASLTDLLSLTEELQQNAEQVEDGIGGFVANDMTRVVPVEELQRPSLDSLSKRIDKIAKIIEGSATRL